MIQAQFSAVQEPAAMIEERSPGVQELSPITQACSAAIRAGPLMIQAGASGVRAGSSARREGSATARASARAAQGPASAAGETACATAARAFFTQPQPPNKTMPTSPYLPKSDSGKAEFLANFATKLSGYSAALGLTAGTVTNVEHIAATFQWVLDVQQLYATHAQDWTSFKNQLRDGPVGGAITPPPAPALPAAPTLPASGYDIFKTISMLVQTIKNNAAYTTAMGEDLGIVGAGQTFDPQTGKPTLALSAFNNDQVRVAWKKGNFQGMRIDVDRGTGGWTFLATDSVPDYIDTHPLPAAPTTWKYRAVYRLDDVNVGEWSDTAQITVG